jgi:hypothetical protein
LSDWAHFQKGQIWICPFTDYRFSKTQGPALYRRKYSTPLETISNRTNHFGLCESKHQNCWWILLARFSRIPGCGKGLRMSQDFFSQSFASMPKD